MWVNLGWVQVDDKYGMTIVDLNNLAYMDKPFVLANEVAQVFYVKDMSSKPRKKISKRKNSKDLLNIGMKDTERKEIQEAVLTDTWLNLKQSQDLNFNFMEKENREQNFYTCVR
jgi:hypothetical protein